MSNEPDLSELDEVRELLRRTRRLLAGLASGEEISPEDLERIRELLSEIRRYTPDV